MLPIGFGFYYSVSDFEANLTFYRDVLQLPVKETYTRTDGRRGAILLVGSNTELEILSTHDPLKAVLPSSGIGIRIRVADIETSYKRLERMDVEILNMPTRWNWGERGFDVCSPGGLRIQLYMVV